MDNHQTPGLPPATPAGMDDPDGDGRGDPQPPDRPRTLSDALRGIAEDPSRARISVGDLLTELRLRAAAALILLFALPNVLPTPPGTSALLGLPLIYLCVQMALGRPPWLPRFISGRSMHRSDFAALLTRIQPWLARAERYLKPRLKPLSAPGAERAAGVICAVLAVLIALPIPFGNMLPALAISIMAMGMLEKDGVWLVAGAVIGMVSMVVVWGVLMVMLRTAAYLFAQAFS